MQENGLLDGVVLPAAEDFAWQDLDCPYRGDLNRRFSYLFSMQEEIPYYSIRETSELQYYDAKDVEVPRESIWARGLQSGEEMQYNLLSTENLGFYRICNPNARSARRVLILFGYWSCVSITNSRDFHGVPDVFPTPSLTGKRVSTFPFISIFFSFMCF